ncbi:MAG: sugar ABC transporter substrate-binding protein [Firmicutes bacterium]|nr:sugar ABC transporter substrate-binding protein [Bacillota bacterium]
MKKYITSIISLVVVIFIFYISYISLSDYCAHNLSAIKYQPVRIGATYMTLNNPFFEVIDDEMRNLVEANGDILMTLDPQLSLERQIEEIRYFIDEDFDVIIVNPVDSKGLIDILKEASDKGIRIIAIDTSVYEDNDFIDYTVVSDNYYAGVLCAEDMMNTVDEARIIILGHDAANSALNRVSGFMDTIKDNPNYIVEAVYDCEGQLEQAMPVIEKCIDDMTDFNVVMCINDPSALGAIAALQSREMLDKVMVYGIDGTPEAKVLIYDGYMQATVAQYPKRMARKAIDSAYALLNNSHRLTDEKIGINLINALNIDEYSLEGWQ